MLPFGLDLKSLIVGILIAYFLIPRLLGFFAARKGNAATTK